MSDSESNPDQVRLSDQLQRLTFDNLDVRGAVVELEQSYKDVLDRAEYPASIRLLLGEMLAAVVLLSSNLKIEGRISLQAMGEGDVRILLAECNHRNEVRAIARFAEDVNEVEPQPLNLLLENARMAITIDPDSGQRYQGVVPLEHETVAECIQAYFDQSEQLPTTIQLAADGARAAGLMLQVLPAAGSGNRDWEHVSTLAQTLQAREMLELDAHTLLYRLFHQEQVRVFEPEHLEFKCECSRQRSANALQMMTEAELMDLIEEQDGQIEMGCQFCNEIYRFDSADIQALFRNEGQLNENSALH